MSFGSLLRTDAGRGVRSRMVERMENGLRRVTISAWAEGGRVSGMVVTERAEGEMWAKCGRPMEA